MAEILFASFLEDEETYDEAAVYWQKQFEMLLEDFEYEYELYLNTVMADGTPLRDGNPIFNAYLPVIHRAVRIIQEEPEEPAEYSRWIHETEDAEGEPFEELVVSLVLTEETLELALEDIRLWVMGEAILEEEESLAE